MTAPHTKSKSRGADTLKAISIDASVKNVDGWKDTQIVLDSGAECNTIPTRLALELKLPRVDGPTPTMTTAWQDQKRCDGVYRLTFKAADQWKQQRKIITTAYASDMWPTNIILGLPGLRDARILIDGSTTSWRFATDNPQMEKDPDTFIKDVSDSVIIGGIFLKSVNTLEGEDNTKPKEPTLPRYLEKYKQVFDEKAADSLPPHRGIDHAIDLIPGKEAPWGPLYNLSERELEELRKYIDDALEKEWIQPSISPAGAPILFVPKKDASLRLCVDYRALNSHTVKNRCPLPLISETLDRLRKAKIFTKLDLKNAYHRIRIKEGDEWKTAFRTRYGHFEYLVMPFGLSNAPATFQAYINRALAGLLDDFCVAYMDDMIIFSEEEKDHENHVITVIERLEQHGLYVKLSKCAFSVKEVEFLGYIVSTEGVSMDSSRVTAITNWPQPNSLKDIQTFNGVCNFYRRFIAKYSTIAKPLTDMLKGGGSKPFKWEDEQETAFRRLKDAFTKAPLLKYFEPELPIRIETDASSFGIAAILSQQKAPEPWHPVAFMSRKLIPAEMNYDTHDQELLAIVEAFKQWRHYADGAQHTIEVLCDHDNLRAFMKATALTPRQARWATKLSAFDLTIIHRPGKSNPADGPSRRPDYEGENIQLTSLLPTLQRKLQLLSEATGRKEFQECNSINAVVRAINVYCDEDASTASGERGDNARLARSEMPTEDVRQKTNSVSTERVRQKIVDSRNPERASSDSETRGLIDVSQTPTWGRYVEDCLPRAAVNHRLEGESIYTRPTEKLVELIKTVQKMDAATNNQIQKINESATSKKWAVDSKGCVRHNSKLYVPDQQALRQALLKLHHDDPMAGHFGVERTNELIQREFYWEGIAHDVEEYVNSCDRCQRTKAPRHKPYGELHPLPTPSRPFEQISMDFIAPLPPSRRTDDEKVFDAILVVVDRFTKYAVYIACTRDTTASKLADDVINQVILRFGTPSNIVSDRGSLFTSKYWSELAVALKIRLNTSTAFHPQSDGQTERQNQTLEHYLRTYCNREQNDWADRLLTAAFAYNNSRQSSTMVSPHRALMGYDLPLLLETSEDQSSSIPHVQERLETLQKTRIQLQEHLERAKEWQAKAYNQKHKPKSFKIGDMVLLSTKNIKQNIPSKKLGDKYAGPYRVHSVTSASSYRLEMPPDSRIHPVFHVSLLEPYNPRIIDADSQDQRSRTDTQPTGPEEEEEPEAEATAERSETQQNHKTTTTNEGDESMGDRRQIDDLPTTQYIAPPLNLENVEDTPTVEYIIDRKRKGKKWVYLAKYKELDSSHNEWLPTSMLDTKMRRDYDHKNTKPRRKPRKHWVP